MPYSAFPFAAFHDAKDNVLHRKKRLLTITIMVSYVTFYRKLNGQT